MRMLFLLLVDLVFSQISGGDMGDPCSINSGCKSQCCSDVCIYSTECSPDKGLKGIKWLWTLIWIGVSCCGLSLVICLTIIICYKRKSNAK